MKKEFYQQQQQIATTTKKTQLSKSHKFTTIRTALFLRLAMMDMSLARLADYCF